MKIIDFHTHFYPDKIVARALAHAKGVIPPATGGTRHDLLQSMHNCGISESVALALVNKPENARSINAWTVEENHGKIHMLGSLHPSQTDLADTVKFLTDNNIKGVKLHPEYQNFRFDDEQNYPIFELCAANNLFIVTHAGYDAMYMPPYRCTPLMLRQVVNRFPELTLIAAHLGGLTELDEAEEYLIGSNIYLDTAFVQERFISVERLTKIVKAHGTNRVLFGSDSPWLGQQTVIDYIKSMPLSESEFEQIFYRNAQTLLRTI